MIYITGDMHNTIDMSNISIKKLKNYCYWQKMITIISLI